MNEGDGALCDGVECGGVSSSLVDFLETIALNYIVPVRETPCEFCFDAVAQIGVLLQQRIVLVDDVRVAEQVKRIITSALKRRVR